MRNASTDGGAGGARGDVGMVDAFFKGWKPSFTARSCMFAALFGSILVRKIASRSRQRLQTLMTLEDETFVALRPLVSSPERKCRRLAREAGLA